jgi:hypothetical protein
VIVETVLMTICGLLFRRCPTAIARFVVPVIVREAIKRMFKGRSLAHVCQEIRKATPSLAGRNAAPAIVFVPGIIGVEAPILHASPNSIRRIDVAMPDGVTMNQCIPSRSTFPSTRTTGRRISSKQIVGSNHRFISAIALAIPHSNPARTGRASAHGGEHSKPFSSELWP